MLRRLGEAMRKHLHMPVVEVVRRIVNPIVRGWVNYFRWGNAGRDLSFVSWQVDTKVRRFASRQRPKRRGGRTWTTWSTKDIYETWGCTTTTKWAGAASRGKQGHITTPTDSTGNAGWRQSPCPV
jgi:Group II intron, maturase-specific domain